MSEYVCTPQKICQLQGSQLPPPPAASQDAVAGKRQVSLYGKVALYLHRCTIMRGLRDLNTPKVEPAQDSLSACRCFEDGYSLLGARVDSIV
jgi:hypothetical protein|eukprot:COSAG01_NODE_20849_length_932_cov_1.007203_2_plen_92_part_00